MKELNRLKSSLENKSSTSEDVHQIIAMLDAGEIRVADKIDDTWQINEWIKQYIIEYFKITTNEIEKIGNLFFRDKLPLKSNFENVRIVPGGNSIRYGSYLSDNVIMMPPSYVNIGVYVGVETMIDSNVLVGSCAQIGDRVHLSAGVQIGGVLEPLNARPVIIEDHAFIGAGAIVVEGSWVRKNAVLAPGVVLSASTKVLETDKNGKVIKTYYGEIPENAIVVPGARSRGEIMIQTPIIIGYKDQNTDAKLQLSNFLRDF